MKRLIAAVAASGGLIGGCVAVSLVLTAQSAAAATPPLTAAQKLCQQGYGGTFLPAPDEYTCFHASTTAAVAFKGAQEQCLNAYGGEFFAPGLERRYTCELPPS